jgi:glycosyltransferase involved in cell wall biosynthesis
VATAPFFVLGPNTLLALIGLLRGPRPVERADPEVVKRLKIDVVIPAYNEGGTIALCLASLMRQTVTPHSIIVIDDGSSDDTAAATEAFAAANGVPIRLVRRHRSVGKTPGLEREAHELEGEVEFILDADTVLMSEDYIEKVVAQLYRVPGIASASGAVYPLRERDRLAVSNLDSIQRLKKLRPETRLTPPRSLWHRIAKGVTNFYRDVLYHFLQNFIYVGHQNLFGSIMNPVGCAVAYRREYLKALFDRYEPALGDDMTSSEDIFFGFVFIEEGYHNVQVREVYARSDEPEAQKVPRQLLMWSSAWLQSAYYFPELLLSPFRTVKRINRQLKNSRHRERRRVIDSYREPFGARMAKHYGRPAGWLTFFAIFEKISFPSVLICMVAIRAWWTLEMTIALEMALYIAIVMIFSENHRLKYVAKGLVATPLRYGSLGFDVVVISRFLFDIFTGHRPWRK